ncbi:DEKNAAC101654 [Brettanomyces naardenensis]|uniref:DEKNAAC101654 n=1 Tax=Brettanomyces naardenensis TaxID=13370 RepID=A0A448YIT7_BRENA|nr:DEKNAAC101654 [Brettanomyces naardenensis]
MDNRKRKVDFDIHIAAMAQAFVSIALCIPMFLHPSFTEDPIFGTYEFGGLVAAITTGYFVWDLLYCCIYHFDIYGFEYLFHASGALVVFASTFRGFLQPLIPAFLVYELSTPFVNLHWFYTRGPKGFVSDRTFMINGALLMLTFFMARCVWGVYASVKAFQLCLAVRDQLPRFLMPIIFSLNLGFQFLNFFWFYKMVRIAVRKSKSKKE